MIKWFHRYIQTDNHYFLITHSLKAFILFYKNVGEHDRRYSLLTEDFGKISVIVRRILKPDSKLAGHLEPPSFSWVELVETAKGFQLTQALEQNSFSNLRKNPGAISLVLRLTEFLDGFLSLDPSPEVFSVWGSFLAKIEEKSGDNPNWQLLEAQFIFQALKEFGFLPDILHCSNCQKPAGKESVFYDGQVFCFDCAKAKNISGENLDEDFHSEYQKILAGEILFKPQTGLALKKIAFYFKPQAQSYML